MAERRTRIPAHDDLVRLHFDRSLDDPGSDVVIHACLGFDGHLGGAACRREFLEILGDGRDFRLGRPVAVRLDDRHYVDWFATLLTFEDKGKLEEALL